MAEFKWSKILTWSILAAPWVALVITSFAWADGKPADGHDMGMTAPAVQRGETFSAPARLADFTPGDHIAARRIETTTV